MIDRVNITLPRELLARLDRAAALEHTTRSGFIRAAVLQRMGAVALPTAGAGSDELAGANLAQETGAAYAPAGAPAPPEAPAPPPACEVVLAQLRAFFAARDDVDVAYLFGSVVKGETGPLSDVDVAVLLPWDLDRPARFGLALDLAGRLAQVLGVQRVDVVELNDAGVALSHQVVTTGALVADRDGKAAAFELDTLAKYEDYLPVIEAHERALLARIHDGRFAR